MIDYIAPAGTPVGFADLVFGLCTGLFSRRSSQDEMQAHLLDATSANNCWKFSSGRAAMTVALEAMKATANDSRRREVILPAYTCWSVAAAVVRAGLQPRLCDLDPETLSFDLQSMRRFEFESVLAVVSANLYGVPNALAEIESMARHHGVLMLDDAAQCLGARYATRAVGGFGDAGILSFERGKNITTLKGGAVVARDSVVAATLERIYASVPHSALFDTASSCVKLTAYALCFRPALYARVRSIPWLELGTTVYDDTYIIARYPDTLSGLGARMCRQLDRLNHRRRHRAVQMTEALQGMPGLGLLTVLPDAEPVYARLPLFINAPHERAAVLNELDVSGIGASTSYPLALCDVPQVRGMLPATDCNMPGARQIASTIVTLPTHDYCTEDLPSRVRAVIQRCLSARFQ